MPSILLEKRYKIEIEVDVRVIDVSQIEGASNAAANADFTARLVRLQKAILADKRTLTALLIRKAISGLEDYVEEFTSNRSPLPSYYDYLKSVIDTLEPSDADFFLTDDHKDVIDENIWPVTLDGAPHAAESCDIAELVDTTESQSVWKLIWSHKRQTD